jgi:tetratricopeptide (TPR) repeat protein
LESPKIAETYLRGTVEILRDLVKLPSHQYLEELSIALNALGQYLWLSKRSLSEALTCHEESLELARTLLTASPNDPAILRDVAISLERRGDVLLSLGRLREAESDYRQRLKIARDLAERDPGNKIWQEDLSIARERLESVTH